MHVDLLLDSLTDRFRRFVRRKGRPDRQEQQQSSSASRKDKYDKCAIESGEPAGNTQSFGPFNNAHHFVVNQPLMLDRIQTVNMISGGKTVLEHLAPYTQPDAAMDSNARHPPPLCHPGTRSRVMGKLEAWLKDHKRQWNMIWLHGPLGIGKSAVAQTFAERCSDKGRLGAAFFFSRPDNRRESEFVVPTLAYQLAVHCPPYKSLLTDRLANDPQLLKKAPQVQFKRFIVDPFLELQNRSHQCIEEPFIVILDGLDECDGERAQYEMVKMISEAVQSKILPLLWLICSRPEAHLKYAFSRIIYCGREELFIDAECRDDVNRYLWDGLAAMRVEFKDVVPSSWPPQHQFEELLKAVSGLFIFASTGLKYIGDPSYANPVDRLCVFLSFLKRIEGVGTKNRLEALDLLYIYILADISHEILPTTRRILSCFIFTAKLDWQHRRQLSAQTLCNFLRLDQSAFYSALWKLHSVIEVPAPDDAFKTPLQFYHASFQDFLLDADRSGIFAIEKQKAMVDIAKSCLFWHQVDITHFHTNDGELTTKTDRVNDILTSRLGWYFDYSHEHPILPSLEWVSLDNQEEISAEIAEIAEHVWGPFSQLSENKEEDILLQIRNFDFRYIFIPEYSHFLGFVNWFYEQNPSDPILRTEPLNEVDFQLLKYMKAVTNQESVEPATFPLNWENGCLGCRQYFFIGDGPKSIIVWITERSDEYRIYTLNYDMEPSEDQIEGYHDYLLEIRSCATYESEDEMQEEEEENGQNEDKDLEGRQ